MPNTELDLFFVGTLPECETKSAAAGELMPKWKSNKQIREPLYLQYNGPDTASPSRHYIFCCLFFFLAHSPTLCAYRRTSI